VERVGRGGDGAEAGRREESQRELDGVGEESITVLPWRTPREYNPAATRLDRLYTSPTVSVLPVAPSMIQARSRRSARRSKT